MRILINFSTLKKGGGQNVALNFLKSLIETKNSNHLYFFLVVENSTIHKFLLQSYGQNILVTSQNPIRRILKEFFVYSSFLKRMQIDIIYTYFGYALFKNNIPQVCGVAVSNIFFPEIKFWDGNYFRVLTRKIIDKYRIFGIKKASALIFENKKMKERSNTLLKIPENRTIFIPPSFSLSIENEEINIPELKSKSTKILMLCGWQLNKNIMKVPEIAYNLKNSNLNYLFIITTPNDYSRNHKIFLSLVSKYKVHNMISIIGPVKKQQLQNLYEQIDLVLLMSKLESFSNNIIEAWQFLKPLIVSDEEWSHSICNNAAYYVNRENSVEIAESIEYITKNHDIQRELVDKGLKQLNNYPTIMEKTKSEIKFLEQIYNEFKTIS